METKHRKGDFLLNVEKGGLVKWDPYSGNFNSIDFLFLTSALKKAEGLGKMWKSDLTFGAWAPENPPDEANSLPLDALIRDKAKFLTLAALYELDKIHKLKSGDIPKRFLVGDTHPSLGYPGETGDKYLIKPPKGLSLKDVAGFIYGRWSKFDGPVTVQLSSAYAMTNDDGKLLSCMPKKDSVYITYPKNPLLTFEDVTGYLEFLKKERYPNITIEECLKKGSNIAGFIMNEYLFAYAVKNGIHGTVSRTLSHSVTPDQDAILGIGATGLTPAIVGWIEKQARRSV